MDGSRVIIQTYVASGHTQTDPMDCAQSYWLLLDFHVVGHDQHGWFGKPLLDHLGLAQ